MRATHPKKWMAGANLHDTNKIHDERLCIHVRR
jgi:hypothetical protein